MAGPELAARALLFLLHLDALAERPAALDEAGATNEARSRSGMRSVWLHRPAEGVTKGARHEAIGAAVRLKRVKG